MNNNRPSQPTTSASAVSAVVVQYGSPDLLLALIESLGSHGDGALISELLIVDNGGNLSADQQDRILKAATHLDCRLVETQGTTYSGGVNTGVRASSNDLVLVMNNDLVWHDGGSIRSLIEAMTSDAVGIAGPQLLNEDGSWQRSHGPFPSVASAIESILFVDTMRNAIGARRAAAVCTDPARGVDYVDGALMCVRRRCFDEIGGLDESLPFYGEDTDFCYRAARAGWDVVFVPSASVIHVRGATSTRENPDRFERKLFRSKVGFVRRTAGRRSARAYAHLLRAALAVRAFIYPLSAALTRTDEARDRAASARRRYAAVRGLPIDVS